MDALTGRLRRGLHAQVGHRLPRMQPWVPRLRVPLLWVMRPCAGAAAALFAAGQAHAQLIDRYFPANIPAYQDWGSAALTLESDGSYGPTGVRVGSFVLHPSASQSLGYDSNPFGSSGNHGTPESDTNVSVSADSDWARNSVNASIVADRLQYFDYPSQSPTTWTASAGGSVSYAEDQIDIGYSHVNGVTLPTDVGSFALQGPIVDQVDDLRVSDTIGPGPLILVPSLDGQLYRFSQVANSVPTNVAQDLFNRNGIIGSLTAGYEFAGGHNVVVIISDSQVGYQNSHQAVRPADYNDVSVLAGIEYQQSALLAYRALVGYEQRSSTGSGIPHGTVSAPAAELDVIWKFSALTSLTAKVSQSLQNEPSGVSQGLTVTQASLALENSLRRNIRLNASLEYNSASAPTGSGNQSTVEAAASATWTITRNWSLSLRYDYTKADASGGSLSGFDRQQIFLQASFQL
jgi:hypothetical protein